MTTKFSLDFIREENDRLLGGFYKKYPRDMDKVAHLSELAHIQETVRGLYVLNKWEREGRSGNPVGELNFYSVITDVVTHIAKTYIADELVNKNINIDKPEKRKNRWGSFDKWAKENQGKQFTTDQLVEVAGFSYPTVLKYVSESPLFIKIKKGLWQVSSPSDE